MPATPSSPQAALHRNYVTAINTATQAREYVLFHLTRSLLHPEMQHETSRQTSIVCTNAAMSLSSCQMEKKTVEPCSEVRQVHISACFQLPGC